MSEIKKYRKKSVVVEAVQFMPLTVALIADWIRENGGSCTSPLANEQGEPFKIATLEGAMEVGYGDYVIRGVKDEFYPCREDIFAATYEEAQA